MIRLNHQKIIALLALVSATYSNLSFAFPCFFTVAKDNCWEKYSVRVSITDTKTNKEIATIDIPQGKLWGRVSLECQPSQQFLYKATFEPSFWQNDTGKVYQAKQYWSLPNVVGKEDKGWEVPICFPNAFAEVPFPPGASGDCHCDFQSIPAPQP
ncbi:MAG: hypothetical protein H2069_09215 [Legionella sp.]|nr:hypothetical protein [Legionella sp.]